MRSLFAAVRSAAGLSFSLFGAVVGAGFISGAELVRFFPQRGILPHAAVAAGLFAACFFLLFCAGRRWGGFSGMLEHCFGRAAPLFRILLLAASFVTCAAMLAGLDGAVRTGFGVAYPFPAAALAALPAMFFAAKKGMRGIAGVSSALVPVMLLFIAGHAGGALVSVQPGPPEGAFSSLCGVCLYAAMNCFLCAPIACDAGAAGRGGAGCAVAASLVGFCIAAVLGTVTAAGTAGEELPFLAAGGGKLFAVACICAIVTTLFSSFYPLARAAEQAKRAALWQAALCAAAFLCSLCGLGGIVRTVYPLIGFAGAAFFAVLAASFRPRGLTAAPAASRPAPPGHTCPPPARRG